MTYSISVTRIHSADDGIDKHWTFLRYINGGIKS